MATQQPMQASASPMPEGVTDPNYKPLPGRLGNLSVEQQHILTKFRTQLQDRGVFVPERMDDAFLLRYLRARKFDLEKALEMLIAAEQWRKDYGVQEILDNFDFQEKAEVDKYYPQYYHKMDKDGRPVYIEQLGKLDITALNAITTQERQLKRLVWEYEKFVNERLPACSKAVGHPVETSCTILDLKGVKILKAWSFKEYIQKAAEIGQNRYPETMGKFYIINAPFGFESLWSWIKPWLDPVTVEKIAILSRDSKDKLLAQIPPENLPKDLGGSCSCPGGCSLADSGPWQQQAQQ